MFKPKTLLLAFLAGFIATLLFHQGLLQLLHLAGKIPMAAWNMDPAPPLGVPKVISLAFWGGLWGIALWALIRNRKGIAWFVVFPIKGIELNNTLIGGALLLNGAWGVGVALCMKLLGERRG
jgi:hypothetical protein